MLKLSKHIEGISDWLWSQHPLTGLKGQAIRLLRILAVMRRDLAEGQLTLYAMSLVYTTLLSLVPLLAFSFSVMKGLGMHNRLQPMLFESLSALGPRGDELGERIMQFVENVRADVLGSVGLAILVYLIISLVQKIEASFNFAWRVQQPRGLRQRFADYLSVILIGPLLIATAMGITASLTSSNIIQEVLAVQPLGWLAVQFGKLLPYLIVISTFAFIYVFIPNTRVHWRNAFIGGLVAGILWQSMGWIFSNFIAGSSKYVAIYSSFAIVLTFMIWLYLSWLILLVGANIAYYAQNPQHVTRHRTRRQLSNELREALALEIMLRVARSFHERGKSWDLNHLSEVLNVPADTLATVTQRLENHGLLVVTEAPETAFMPGMDIGTISLGDVLAAVRKEDPEQDQDARRVPISTTVQNIMDSLIEAGRKALTETTLREAIVDNAADTDGEKEKSRKRDSKKSGKEQ